MSRRRPKKEDAISLLSEPAKRGFQPLEPETVRVAAIGDPNQPSGAACLVSAMHLLTCSHVVKDALGHDVRVNDLVPVTLIGVTDQPMFTARVERVGTPKRQGDFAQDIALLALESDDAKSLAIRPVEFATPLIHSGKQYSVMGFPADRAYGLHATGQLSAADRNGLVQMDGSRAIAVAPGFSGAPVWSPDLRAFVGLVVAGEDEESLAWCIPSRILCQFFPNLLVKFRIPPADRPVINDSEVDDPNASLFGEISNNGRRRLTARAERGRRKGKVFVKYECIDSNHPPRGGFVTFITYPDFKWEREDAYELFAPLENGVAEQEFYPVDGFTVAAIGDAGDTALTLDLCALPGKTFPCS